MVSKADSYESLWHFVQDIGIMEQLVTDGDPTMAYKAWNDTIQEYRIKHSTIEPYSPYSFCNPNSRNTYEYSILVYSCTGSTARACRNSATPSVHHGGRPLFYPASSLSAYSSLSQHQPHQQSLYPRKENRKWARNDQFHA